MFFAILPLATIASALILGYKKSANPTIISARLTTTSTHYGQVCAYAHTPCV